MLVFNQVAEFYNKAHIPMMAETKAINKIVQLVDANARIRAIPISHSTTPATCDKLQQEESRLNKTFEIWPPNVDEFVTLPEDRLFLESMKTDWSATFGCSDPVLAAQTRQIAERAAAEARRKDKAQQQMDEASTSFQALSSGEDSHSDVETSGSEFECDAGTPRSHRRTVQTGTSVIIPHNILASPKLVSLGTHMKMTPTQQAAFTRALIEEAGADTPNVCHILFHCRQI